MAEPKVPVLIRPLPTQDPPDAGRVLLRDGTAATVRRLTPADEARVAAFVAGVSAEARGRRFAHGVAPEVAARAICAQADGRVALAVLTGDPDDPQVVGVGEAAWGDGDLAEIALLVGDGYQGRGVGTALLDRLALLALDQGLRRLRAYVQPDNWAMLDVLEQSGYPLTRHREDSYVVVDLDLLPDPDSVRKAEERDHVATVASLVPLFRPRAVAVYGAGRDPAGLGRRILEGLVRGGFQGPVYPIHPTARAVGAVPAYRSLAQVPGPVDLAVVAVPRDAVLQVVDDCGQKGVRALVVISAGFAETGPEGRELERRLVARARGYGMRLVGPNCMGMVNTAPGVQLYATFAPLFPAHGKVAMASQSGALGLAMLEYAGAMGLGVSSFVSMGNKADVSGNDLIQYWEDDPDTAVIALYLESVGNPRRFARLARRVARQKPIVAVKGGRTPAGTRAAGSHTAALAASDVAVDALFRQAGVIRCGTLAEMFDVAALLATQPLPQGPRVAIVTNAGGPGILAADALASAGLAVPETPPNTASRLRAFLPPAAGVGNPVDLIAAAGPEEYRRALEVLLHDPAFDAVLAIFVPVVGGAQEVAGAIGAAVAAARRAGVQKPVLACFLDQGGRRPPLAAGEERIPCFAFPEQAAWVLARAYEYAQWRSEPLGTIPDFQDIDPRRARAICRAALVRGGGWLAPDEAAAVLQALGLPVVAGALVPDAEGAVAAAERMGYPVAVKLASRTLVHKSEWDGVHLGLQDAGAVRRACQEIAGRLEAAGRLGDLEGFWVQPMVAGGTDLMVGVTHDPAFGPLLAFGLGGVHVEVLRDVVFRITPLTDRDADQMMRSIRGFRLLEGYRGHPPADLDAVRDVLLRVSRLVEEVPEILELDLNPVRALPPGQGCRILDVRIRVGQPAQG